MEAAVLTLADSCFEVPINPVEKDPPSNSKSEDDEDKSVQEPTPRCSEYTLKDECLSLCTQIKRQSQHVKILTPVLGFMTRRILAYTKKKSFKVFQKGFPDGCIVFRLAKQTKAQIVIEPLFVSKYDRDQSKLVISGVLRAKQCPRDAKNVVLNFG